MALRCSLSPDSDEKHMEAEEDMEVAAVEVVIASSYSSSSRERLDPTREVAITCWCWGCSQPGCRQGEKYMVVGVRAGSRQTNEWSTANNARATREQKGREPRNRTQFTPTRVSVSINDLSIKNRALVENQMLGLLTTVYRRLIMMLMSLLSVALRSNEAR